MKEAEKWPKMDPLSNTGSLNECVSARGQVFALEEIWRRGLSLGL